MGCASSAPLVEQGKHLVEGVKETANDTLSKGEKAIHDTTETVKDGISSGMESVKETVQSAFNTAEESVGSVAQKIGETFNITSSKTAQSLTNDLEGAQEQISSTKDDVLDTAADYAAEAVSEAETVIVSESEHVKEAFHSGTSPFFETVHSMEEDMDAALKDLENTGQNAMEAALATSQSIEDIATESAMSTIKQGTEILEDIENDASDALGENVKKAEKVLEVLHGDGDHKDEEEENRVEKGEPSPTLWEAAADAILLKKNLKILEPSHHGQKERIFFTPHDKTEPDYNEKTDNENDLVIENTENE